MSERKALETMKLGLIFCAGGFMAVAGNELLTPERSCTEIDQEIGVYVEYMARAGELRGHMTVVDFQEYHELKREYARRCVHR